uniref:Uncharacterized protein n=1 Tax=Pseudomonas phage PMBT23 TaxID=3137284 RepID=A0AAU8BTW6_9VIRU
MAIDQASLIETKVLTSVSKSVEWATSTTTWPNGCRGWWPTGLVVTDQRSYGCQRSQGSETR